jgi:hypothetical protein
MAGSFEVFTVVAMKNTVFWVVASCSSYVNRRFGGSCRLHLQGRRIYSYLLTLVPRSQILIVSTDAQSAATCSRWFLARRFLSFQLTLSLQLLAHAVSSLVYSYRFNWRSVYSCLLTLVPRSQILLHWRWRRYDPPKRRFTQELHGATTQKTASFIQILVKISGFLLRGLNLS